jgi:tetratricopeptide (TPR) repeat protein
MRSPILAVLLTFALLSPATAAGPKWQGQIPQQARDAQPWQDLITYLLSREHNYGAMAAAQRMILLFTDAPTKEIGFKTIISLINRGYPFSSLSPFLPGDIDPAPPESITLDPIRYDFYNSYNLYKSMLNKERKAAKWAEGYLAKVDKENFPKYQLYNAIDLYLGGKLQEAEVEIKKLLTREYGDDQLPFVRKASRTLARIYYEREEYEKALDIYMKFLLKLNPVTSNDWLETAWTLYHLKRYQEALGMLYNMESRSAGKTISLEKYIIRALTFRQLCDVPGSEALVQTFETDFGKAIKGIKRGQSLSKFPELTNLDLAPNAVFRQTALVLRELTSEKEKVKALPVDQQAIANYLYDTEIAILKRNHRVQLDKALDHAASELVMMSERLRFLRFDVAREKFNPDVVFRPLEDEEKPVIQDAPGDAYTIRWIQLGDFWRDERLSYVGVAPSRCGE